jgi:hypothetical protein
MWSRSLGAGCAAAPALTALGRLLSIDTVGFLHDIEDGVRYPSEDSGPERSTYELCHPAAGQLIECGLG